MTYAIKEIFYTLQGEGAQAGRASVFCRFAGCNLWSGREADRADATCQFCDTDFVGIDGTLGGKYKDAGSLADQIASLWPEGQAGKPYVVCTGGEPLLQLDAPLIAALHQYGFEVAVETNGTILPPPGIDWICVSPKAGAEIVLTKGDELKVVIPQAGLDPRRFESLDFRHFAVQPMDVADAAKRDENLRLATAFCLSYPLWRLSLQTHKILGIR
jgi:7-carboxy-7-deazaguanine synthase (Cx14CxxC type)